MWVNSSILCDEVLLRQLRCCGQLCGSCWNNASLIPSSLCCWPRFCIICCQRERCELHYCTNLIYIMTKGKPVAHFACLSISACLRPLAPSTLSTLSFTAPNNPYWPYHPSQLQPSPCLHPKRSSEKGNHDNRVKLKKLDAQWKLFDNFHCNPFIGFLDFLISQLVSGFWNTHIDIQRVIVIPIPH